MLWQLLQATSFVACLPDSQNESWRLPAWQLMQAAVFSAAVVALAMLVLGQGLLAAGRDVLGGVAVARLAGLAVGVVLRARGRWT